MTEQQPFRVISLGAGVQSTAVLMLVLNGEVEADCAIFADTGWEPRAVYEHLERLEALAAAESFPIHRVSAGSIRQMGAMGTGSALDAPFFLLREDGGRGMARRQCTTRLKIVPIRRKIQELRSKRPVIQMLGISMDEIQRVRQSDVKYITNAYPLIDLRWTRQNCVAYLERLGMVAPKSACIGCPFRSDDQWAALEPDEFADAVQWEREVQERFQMPTPATPFVHRQRVPLDQVDFRTREDHGQLTWDDECAGVCGV